LNLLSAQLGAYASLIGFNHYRLKMPRRDELEPGNEPRSMQKLQIFFEVALSVIWGLYYCNQFAKLLSFINDTFGNFSRCLWHLSHDVWMWLMVNHWLLVVQILFRTRYLGHRNQRSIMVM